MDEMTPVRQLRADVPTPDAAHLAGARHQLLRETHGMTRRTAGASAPARRRFTWRWATAGAVVVAMVAGAVVAQQVTAPTPATGDQVPEGMAVAAKDVLYRAAAYAAATPDLTVRDDQFVYVESRTTNMATIVRKGGAADSYLSREHRKIWQSVDGSRPGLLRFRQLDPVALPGQPLPPEAREHARPDWQDAPLDAGSSGYARDLPTDPDKMYDHIYRNLKGKNPRHEQAWITVGDLLRERLLPSQARAALFRAAARIPGVTVVADAADAAGRRGVAVSRTQRGVSEQLIFDAKTYQFLGERGVVVDSKQMGEEIPAGTVVAASAELRCVVVDKVGQEG